MAAQVWLAEGMQDTDDGDLTQIFLKDFLGTTN